MRKILLLLLFPFHLSAQESGFGAFKSYPFTNELCASSSGSRIAWAMNEHGKRNVYVAEGPDFTPKKLTHYSKDDG